MEVSHSTLVWMLFYVSFVSAVILFITGSIFGGKPGSKYLYPKGPRTLPVFGNILTFHSLIKDPDRTLLSFARRYGALCTLWFGSKPVVIISSPRAAKDLLDKASG